jgi:hypothetical protein
MKKCTGCKKIKAESMFWIDRRYSRPMSQCRECKGEKTKQWVAGNPSKYSEWYHKHRDKELERHLIKKYGISMDDYNAMLMSQNGLCAICGKNSPTHRRMDVDHCHTTGKVRGILCTSCNRMLGHSGDKIDVLKSAIKYLSYRKSPRGSSKRVCKEKPNDK